MIIKIKGSNIFKGSGLGNISSLGQPYNVTVTCATAGATITITASGMTTVTSTSGTATMSNIPYGTVATYTVSASGYITKTGTVTSTRTINVTLTATSGGGVVEPEEPGTGGDSIVWYTGYDVLSTCMDESAASYGGFAYNNDAMNNKFVGKQINVISVYISKAGSFTVGIVDSTNNIVDSDVVNISNTGVQTIELNKTLTVNTGCRPFVQAPSDTSKFKYEMSSTISGFPTGMDAYVGVKTIQKFPKYNMNINFGYKQ